MKHGKSYLFICLLAVTGMFLTACSEDDDPPTVTPELGVKEVADLNTDKEANDGHYVFFNLASGKAVSIADSASMKWDIAFSETSIILNGGVSGPGSAAGQVIEGVFGELTEAPESGYRMDHEGAPGISKDWYRYTAMEEPKHAILPVVGKILVVKTTDGHYAKIEIVSYYKGNPDTSTEEFADYMNRVPSAYYTFRYVYQPDGSKTLQ